MGDGERWRPHMRNVGVDQMEDEGRVQEDCGKQVGCAEVRHFRECWER